MLPREVVHVYTPHEGSDLANQINRKLGVCDRKLEEIHSLAYILHMRVLI